MIHLRHFIPKSGAVNEVLLANDEVVILTDDKGNWLARVERGSHLTVSFPFAEGWTQPTLITTHTEPGVERWKKGV